jgi:hypothetical protein
VAGELHSFLCHAVEVRRGHLAAEGGDIGVAEVIDIDEDDVRPFCGEKRAESGETEKCDERAHGGAVNVLVVSVLRQ